MRDRVCFTLSIHHMFLIYETSWHLNKIPNHARQHQNVHAHGTCAL